MLPDIAEFGWLYVAVLMISVIVHEVAHGYVAYMFGDSTAKNAGRLTLNPIPHIDMVGTIIFPALSIFLSSNFFFGWAKPVPYNPYQLRGGRIGEFCVVSAGIVTNGIIALISAGLIYWGVVDGTNADFFKNVIYINIFLAVINIIPLPTLDGAKMLGILLPYRITQHFSNQMEVFNKNPLLTFAVLFILLWIGLKYVVAVVTSIVSFLV
ncbi:MAG: site-2 protease family protein [Alphaproteobacteria bacterium]|nr:site-2 protease family protein [Alphaproteobacteria bacterium]